MKTLTPCLGGYRNILSSLEFQERLPAKGKCSHLHGESQQHNFQSNPQTKEASRSRDAANWRMLTAWETTFVSLPSHTHHGGRQSECGLENSLGFVSARINLVVRCWASHFISSHCRFPVSTEQHINELECDHIPPFTNMIGMEQGFPNISPEIWHMRSKGDISNPHCVKTSTLISFSTRKSFTHKDRGWDWT